MLFILRTAYCSTNFTNLCPVRFQIEISPAVHLLIDPIEPVASSESHPLDAADSWRCNHWRLKLNILGL